MLVCLIRRQRCIVLHGLFILCVAKLIFFVIFINLTTNLTLLVMVFEQHQDFLGTQKQHKVKSPSEWAC